MSRRKQDIESLILVIIVWLIALALAYLAYLKFSLVFIMNTMPAIPAIGRHLHRIVAFSSLVIFLSDAEAQDSTRSQIFSWSAYLDVYYCYDFNKPANNLKPFFLYNHNRHNEININLALVKATYEGKRMRAAAGLMAGTYVNYNLAAEPAALRHVYEATVGVKILKKSNCWIDAGVFPSHIGSESTIAKDNPTLTRSIAAENSPYYETGIKISYVNKENNWHISGLLLNGWQRIRRPDGYSSLCAGTQLTYSPNTKTKLNWSTFLGNDKPDTARQFRFFHNFYGLFSLNEKWKVNAGFDIGWQKRLRSSGYDNWFSPFVVVQYQPLNNLVFAWRGEYYADPKMVIINNPVQATTIKTLGLSINIDKKIGNLCWWRTEYRWLKNKTPVFEKNNNFSTSNGCLSTSLFFMLQKQ